MSNPPIVNLGKQPKKDDIEYVERKFSDGTKYTIKKSSLGFKPIVPAFCPACGDLMKSSLLCDKEFFRWNVCIKCVINFIEGKEEEYNVLSTEEIINAIKKKLEKNI